MSKQKKPEYGLTDICARCGYPRDEHRTSDALCPIYGKVGKLRGWSGGFTLTRPEEKLYTAADLARVRQETVKKCLDVFDEAFGYMVPQKAVDIIALKARFDAIKEGKE
jgi:hypothetical protein